MAFKKATMAAAAFLATLFAGLSSVMADGDGVHYAAPKQVDFMQPATEVMRDLVGFHDVLLWICVAITLLVMGLMLYIFVRFNAKANPKPSRTTHHTLIEVVWTVVPVLILVVIAVPSFKLLYKQDVVPQADVTIKAIGNQWYWSYEYPDHDGLYFDAVMLSDEEARQQGAPRLLGTDNHVVVPVNKTVRVQVTATDVIHAWTIPAFGAKVDAVPGRLNEIWFKAENEGTYYGQCSELCGIRHGFMPIVVEVVSGEKYAAWLEEAKERFASDISERPVRVADARAVK